MSISARVIADSINVPGNNRVTTLELEYPRYIHAQLMTHRAFSRNSSSSRAQPIQKLIEQAKDDPVIPQYWGQNGAGMVPKGTIQNPDRAVSEWLEARDNAIAKAESLAELGVHKEIVNRLLEPFTHIKVVLSATEFENFFELRLHGDAQHEIAVLAREIEQAMKSSWPMQLHLGEWHTPYVPSQRSSEGVLQYYLHGKPVPATHAVMVSASCCAQVSYRSVNDTLEKSFDIFKRLVLAKPVHASPFEHVCTPCVEGKPYANMVGWKQLRSFLKSDNPFLGEIYNGLISSQ